MTTKLPAGWRVELLGLANAVQFRHAGMATVLLWSDGQWTMGRGSTHMPATALGHASDMKQARAVGTAWLVAMAE